MKRTIKKRKEFELLCMLGFCILICEGSPLGSQAQNKEIGNFRPITTNAPSTVNRTESKNVNNSSQKDALQKRNVQFKDLKENTAGKGKRYDPPSEYYREPARDSATSDYTSKPIAFPDSTGRSKQGDEYDSKQLLRGSAKGYGNGQDRISVGHYGAADHSTSQGGEASSFIHSTGLSPGYGGYGGYGYDKRPYDDYHNAYSGGGPQYPVANHGHDSHYYDSGERGGLTFDVYGSKGHYAGGGGEYSYSTYPDAHEPVGHKAPGIDWQHKALLAKSFLIPLASAAVLGIAAALVSNPLLLQLGTVSAPSALVGKRRKRRDLSSSIASNSTLAYRAHHKERHLARV